MGLMQGLHFDELTEGMCFRSPSVTVTEDAIIRFAMEWDPQPFHVDRNAAAQSIFGTLVGSGLQTLLMTYRLYYQIGLLQGTALAGLGMDDVRFLAPLKPGDTIAVDCRVEALRPTRRDERGVVGLSLSTSDHAGSLLLTMTLTALVARRPG